MTHKKEYFIYIYIYTSKAQDKDRERKWRGINVTVIHLLNNEENKEMDSRQTF